jgi:hypothetical protein
MFKKNIVMPFALVMSVFTGCASAPPVQQMSDARQALQAAESVGARTTAPDYYAMAKGHIEKAELALQQGQYSQAREQAEQAKKYALKAHAKAIGNPP